MCSIWLSDRRAWICVLINLVLDVHFIDKPLSIENFQGLGRAVQNTDFYTYSVTEMWCLLSSIWAAAKAALCKWKVKFNLQLLHHEELKHVVEKNRMNVKNTAEWLAKTVGWSFNLFGNVFYVMWLYSKSNGIRTDNVATLTRCSILILFSVICDCSKITMKANSLFSDYKAFFFIKCVCLSLYPIESLRLRNKETQTYVSLCWVNVKCMYTVKDSYHAGSVALDHDVWNNLAFDSLIRVYVLLGQRTCYSKVWSFSCPVWDRRYNMNNKNIEYVTK